MYHPSIIRDDRPDRGLRPVGDDAIARALREEIRSARRRQQIARRNRRAGRPGAGDLAEADYRAMIWSFLEVWGTARRMARGGRG